MRANFVRLIFVTAIDYVYNENFQIYGTRLLHSGDSNQARVLRIEMMDGTPAIERESSRLTRSRPPGMIVICSTSTLNGSVKDCRAWHGSLTNNGSTAC